MAVGRGFADQSISKTYRRLRLLVSVALITMPLMTAASAFLAGGHKLQPSLSDYYFVLKDGGIPRALFLIFLSVVGCVLFAYRGLDDRDNRIHNAAGLFSFGVALFPMRCDVSQHCDCVPGLLPIFHLPSAGLLYLAAVVSALYGGGPKLKAALNLLPDSQKWIKRLNNNRYVSIAMMTLGIVGFFVHKFWPTFLSRFSWIFWIEYMGFLGFGLYWLRLMWLVSDANACGHQMQPPPTAESHDDRMGFDSVAPLREHVRPSFVQWEEIP